MHLPTLLSLLPFLLAVSPVQGHLSSSSHPKSHLEYNVVPGVFKQDDPATDAGSFNYTAENFGLIERGYPSDAWCRVREKTATGWQRLGCYITSLNRQAKRGERYVLLFLGRHGEGFHNAAESYFGTPAWNCYWSERDGNETVTWADAALTPKGTTQALAAHTFWSSLISTQKITPPQSYYTSPLTRAIQTAQLTFSHLPLPRHSPFTPTIKELFREGISAHTCDRRSRRSTLHAAFPAFRFERGFSEHDPYWQALRAETPDAQDARSKTVLADVFENDESTYVSVTAHSGEIASLLRVLGHRVFGLGTGAALPVLVRVSEVKGVGPTPTGKKTDVVQTCAAAPTVRDASCNDCSCCL